MWKRIKDNEGTAGNDINFANPFADRKATASILLLLEETDIGRRVSDQEEHQEKRQWDDEWG